MTRFVLCGYYSVFIALSLAFAGADAQHCRPVLVTAAPVVHRAPVVHQAVRVVDDISFYGAAFVAFPVYQPSYTVQYPSGGGVADPALTAKIDALTATVAAMKAQYEGIRGPAAAAAPMPAAAPAATPEDPDSIESILRRCAECHESAAARTKGQGFVMVEGTKSRQLGPGEALKCQKRVELGEMPPGRPLSEKGKAVFRKWVLGT